jgi:COP9 signalosome complex subunit 3
METRSYAAAKPILDNYIHSLPSTIPNLVKELEYSVPAADHVNSGEYIHAKSGHTDKIGALDVQEYYVLGGMAYIGLQEYKKALEFLEHVLVVPSFNIANGLMLEAYKKWVLLGCLVHGSVSHSQHHCCARILMVHRCKQYPERQTALLSS